MSYKFPEGFPTEEDYKNRLARARVLMKREGIDVLSVVSADVLRFFTGLNGLPVTRPIWLVIPQEGEISFVTAGSEYKEVLMRTNTPVGVRWVEWYEDPSTPMTHQDALKKLINKVAPDAKTIGIDYTGTNAAIIEAVKQTLGAERIKDITYLIHELFAIKDKAAINVIRMSGDIAGHMVQASMSVIAPGATEWEVSLASYIAATKRQAELYHGDVELSPLAHGLYMTVSGPERTARCHGACAGRILEDGDIVQLCRCSTGIFGHLICYDRLFQVGKKLPSTEMIKIIRYAYEAQQAALKMVKPGSTGEEVHAAAMEVIDRGGWKNPLLHRTGRSLGYSGWDGQELKAGSNCVLQPGMVFTVEPGIYVDGVGGARFGDTVLVTETGYEVLTPFKLGKEILNIL